MEYDNQQEFSKKSYKNNSDVCCKKLDKNETNEKIVKNTNCVKSDINLKCLNNVVDSDKEMSNTYSSDEENLLYNSYNSDSIDENINIIKQKSRINIYKPNKINFLHNQNIEIIRNRKKLFTDDVFKPSIKSLTSSTSSSFAYELFRRFNCHQNSMNLDDLAKEIRWKRCQVILIFTYLNNELNKFIYIKLKVYRLQ